MRTVVTGLVAMTLIGLWLATRYSDGPRQVPGVTGETAMPDPMPQVASFPAGNQEEFQAASSDESASDAIDSNEVSEPALQTAKVEFGPEMRDKIVNVLSESGLAPTDAGRIADAAIADFGECIELGFDNRAGRSISNEAETCLFNALADYGLNASALSEVNLAAVSLP